MKQDDYLQIDETPVKVLDPKAKGKAATGITAAWRAGRNNEFFALTVACKLNPK